jgi:hypothetical protein
MTHRSNYVQDLLLSTLLTCFLLIGTGGCSPKGNTALFGKWKLEKTTVNFANGAHDEQPGGKAIEFRNDGTYVEGEKNGRTGKYEVVDAQHLRIQIDGLAGEPKIVLQGDTLDICNPDGTSTKHYRRLQ